MADDFKKVAVIIQRIVPDDYFDVYYQEGASNEQIIAASRYHKLSPDQTPDEICVVSTDLESEDTYECDDDRYKMYVTVIELDDANNTQINTLVGLIISYVQSHCSCSDEFACTYEHTVVDLTPEIERVVSIWHEKYMNLYQSGL